MRTYDKKREMGINIYVGIYIFKRMKKSKKEIRDSMCGLFVSKSINKENRIVLSYAYVEISAFL